MWIARENESLLAELAAQRAVVMVTGARQTGKTRLLEHAFPRHRYVSLDVPAEAEAAERAGEAFLARHGTPLIVDEVQYAPDLLRYIKHRVDRQRDLRGQYLLIGSQKFELMRGVTESLAGRVTLMDCYSLSARELEAWHGRTCEGPELLGAIVAGGYPEVHTFAIPPARFYADYLATYLRRDVQALINVRSLRDFDRFMRLLALRTGQLTSNHALAGEVGVSAHTIGSWLSVLEASQVIVLLEPWHGNPSKRLVKTPKLYFLDTGLACYLAGVRSAAALAESPLLGAMFETHTVGQLLRARANRGESERIYFYRDQHGHEVDLVVPEGGALHLFECKWAERAPRRVAGFAWLRRQLGDDAIASASVVTSRRGRYAGAEFDVCDSLDFRPGVGCGPAG